MLGENLTRVEAVERASHIVVESYMVELDVTRGSETFFSRTTVTFSAAEGSATFVDAITRAVHRLSLNGQDLAVSAADGFRIHLENLAATNVLIVEADFAYTNTGEGLHRFVDPVDNEVYLYSQFEVPDSRRVFAVFEQPDLKATFQFTVTAPATWQVVSNMASPPAKPTHDASAAVWSFAATPPISSYITALVAGPYSVVRSELTSSSGRVIPLGIFCRASLAEYLDADYIFEKTRQGFTFYEAKFDVPYPFEKYDQLFVPEFNAGAMENAGCVTFTEAYIFRSKVTNAMRERRVVTILHELAHMWFGDLVTMRWWNDLWLNESFAEYASTLATAEATEWTEAWTTFAAMEKSWAYRQDQLPSTHPIVAEIRDLDDVQVNFDGITYAKGGSVLKQLGAWVGQDEFLAGVSNYFKKHAWGNTELNDLMVELEATSGRDLKRWTTVWLETAGVNTLRTRISCAADGTIDAFAIEQTAPTDWPTIRPHRMAIGLYDLDGESVTRIDRIELDVDGPVTEVPQLIGRPRPGLILLNDDDLAYAKIRLDAASVAFAVANLSRIADPLARSLVWGSIWDATRDAEIPARTFIELVHNNIENETESTTVRTTLAQLGTALTMYTSRATRADQIRVAGDRLWQLAQSAEAGSDNQFQFVKAFSALSRTEDQLDTVAALRGGHIALDGLDIDTDLGWDLLIALVAGGRATEDDVDAYLAEDNTATGKQSAANAKATVPSVAAKQRAWDSVFVDDSASNLIIRNTGLGFLRAADVDLLTPFVAQYFAALEGIWQDRSFQIAEALILDFFPAALANAELQAAANDWLAHHAGDPALRRLIIENLAGVDRALAAQIRDTQED